MDTTVCLIISFHDRITSNSFAIVLCVREENLERRSSLRKFLEIKPNEACRSLNEWMWDLHRFHQEHSRPWTISQDLRAHCSLLLPSGFTIMANATDEHLLNQEITLLEVDVVETNR